MTSFHLSNSFLANIIRILRETVLGKKKEFLLPSYFLNGQINSRKKGKALAGEGVRMAAGTKQNVKRWIKKSPMLKTATPRDSIQGFSNLQICFKSDAALWYPGIWYFQCNSRGPPNLFLSPLL